MTKQTELDKIFENPEAVKKLQYIYGLENGELVDEYKLDDLMTELKQAQLVGFMNDYMGLSRCYISKLALAEMQKRGIVQCQSQ